MTLLTIIQPLMIGTTELLLIAGLALLMFGGKKLPEMMRGMGKGIKSFKEGMNESDPPKDNNTEDEGGQQDGQEDKGHSVANGKPNQATDGQLHEDAANDKK